LVLGPLLFSVLLTAYPEVLQRLCPDLAHQTASRLGINFGAVDKTHPKVTELAYRGITVEQLLDFYAKLGRDVMPHFDPLKSTTADVVFQAIIPLSRCHGPAGGGDAYATVVSGGEPRLPTRMVTHAWGNLFAHLLAAVLADCFGNVTYAEELEHLINRDRDSALEALRRHVAPCAKRTYWICAFSVNQHAGICAQESTCDSHGVPICPCTCGLEKHWSGDACEMNKFDEMMAYLKVASPGFGQVVAVDRGFVLFSRIWCIAELLEARRSHLPQTLQVLSREVVERHRESLEDLDVRKAQASFDADRELVLSKIRDPDQFNKELRDLLLHPKVGLLAAWMSTADLGAAASRYSMEEVLHIAMDGLVVEGVAEI